MIDFGSARYIYENESNDKNNIEEVEAKKLSDEMLNYLKTHQQPITRVGSPEFAAPEIISQQTIGTEADIWSLGVLIYVLVR